MPYNTQDRLRRDTMREIAEHLRAVRNKLIEIERPEYTLLSVNGASILHNLSMELEAKLLELARLPGDEPERK